MNSSESFADAVYAQIKKLAIAVLPVLIKLGFTVKQRFIALGVICLIAFVQVSLRSPVSPATVS